jgi:hypothetical protein
MAAPSSQAPMASDKASFQQKVPQPLKLSGQLPYRQYGCRAGTAAGTMEVHQTFARRLSLAW